MVALLQRRVVDIWRLMSSVGTRFHEHARRPAMDSEALVSLFEAHRAELTVEPAEAARILRSFTLAMTHPMMVSEPLEAGGGGSAVPVRRGLERGDADPAPAYPSSPVPATALWSWSSCRPCRRSRPWPCRP